MSKKTKSIRVEISETAKPADVENVEKEVVEITETAKPDSVGLIVDKGMVEPKKPVVPLKVFLNIFGKKWDQMAGFKHYATKNCLEPLTVEEWREAFQNFMDRPIA